MVLNGFKSGIFPLQPNEGTGHPSILARVVTAYDRFGLKMLTPKQILQRLSKLLHM